MTNTLETIPDQLHIIEYDFYDFKIVDSAQKVKRKIIVTIIKILINK